MKIRRTRRADADIKEIYKYTVQEFGEIQAELYLGGVRRHIKWDIRAAWSLEALVRLCD